MEALEFIRDLVLLLALPTLAILSALQPLGRIYATGVAAYVAAFFLCLNYSLEDVDGPAGIGVLFYFLVVALMFTGAHAFKLAVAVFKRDRGKRR